MDNSTKDFYLHNITPVPVKPPGRLFCLDDRVFFIGSCFSSYLFSFLKYHFFRCTNSPFGNTYNPFSIARILDRLLDGKPVDENEVFEYNGLYRHFDFHTEICKPEKVEFISHVNGFVNDAALFLRETTVIIITLGTAYAFFHRKTGQVVNNCHTLPGQEFERRILSINEITKKFKAVVSRLKENRKDLFIIFTLSPVRHLRNRAEENTLSKAVLCCAINELLCLPDTYYFPSYEIMLDELRDYRFYGNDLCHPNEKSVHYIMKRFCESCLCRDAGEYLGKVVELRKACMHKPKHPGIKKHMEFRQAQEEILSGLQKEYPGMPLPAHIDEIV
ncbi:MAG: GSCFA domain-containing protein [Spirochaetales bacterium]|nr:GSCFA domain-containing protein [Spirochaetales bacterium]